MRKYKNVIGGMAVIAALGASIAHADQYHYNNVLVGDRASGMGGAYTAVADDPSGLFYNPAGIIYGGKRNISASVNAFNLSTTTYKSVLGGDWTRKSSNLLPNFFGVTQPLGPGTIGASYAVTDSILEDQSQEFDNFGNISKFVINVNNSEKAYKAGPSYAMPINNSLAIGLTLYGHYFSQNFIVNQWVRRSSTATTDPNAYQWLNQYFKKDEYGVNPVLGIMWSPFDKLSLGMTIRKTFVLSTSTETQTSCVSNISTSTGQCLSSTGVIDTTNPKDPSRTTIAGDRKLPLTTTFGFALFPNNQLLLSGDFSYYFAPDSSKVDTWNAAIGGEYYFTNIWAMRAGLYTNNANTGTLVSGRTGQADHVNLYGFSVSLSRFTRTSALTGGFSYSGGNGQAQVIDGSTSIQDVSVQSFNFYLSTSYSY